jgi:hypothetical protein
MEIFAVFYFGSRDLIYPPTGERILLFILRKMSAERTVIFKQKA